MLLKKAAAKDLTPFAIASIMCREGTHKSPMEKLHSRALALARCSASVDEEAYLRHMSDSLDDYLDQLILEQVA